MKNWLWKNLANIITAFGFFLVLWLVAVTAYDPDRLWLALLLFLAAGLTDFLDGKIARRYNLITKVGKLLDRVRDKILVCSILPLLLRYRWPEREDFFLATTVTLALVAGIMLIELFLLIAGFVGVVRGKDVGASNTGKIKMFAEFIVIASWLLCLNVDKYAGLDLFTHFVYLIDAMLAFVFYYSINSLGEYCYRYAERSNSSH